MWRKVFRVVHHLLAVLGVVFLVMAAMQGVTYYRMQTLNASAAQFVAQALPVIVGSWDIKEFDALADPLLYANTSHDAVAKIFTRYSALGALLESQGCEGQAQDATLNNKTVVRKVVVASYTCKLKFEKDTAQIKVDMLHDDTMDTWRIIGFNILSNNI
jgi:hypothetical protein